MRAVALQFTTTRRRQRSALAAGGLILCLLAVSALGADTAPADPEAYVREIEAWRQDRLERLTRPDSWLSLAGLFWLEEGDNRSGSDTSNEVLFPSSAPPRVGVFRLVEGKVEFTAQAGAGVLLQGQPVTTVTLTSDAEGAPTVLELGSLSFLVIRRGDRFAVRLKDSQSPTRLGFRGIDSYPINPSWRMEATYEPYDPPKSIPVPTVVGIVLEESSPGAVVFQAAGRSHRLDVLPGAEEEEELFIIFGDPTNGKETYGGGRFLYAATPDADGRVILDFNKAYNPPCAFTAYATCPLPPEQNRLDLPVRAGEKKYADGHH